MAKGLVHIYHGDGKGKTSAAMGLALRALGNGWRVGILQFLKGGPSGEITALQTMPGVTILRGRQGTKFSFQMTAEEKQEARALHEEHLEQIARQAAAGDFDLLVLDEALGAIGAGLLSQEGVLRFVRQKPEALELVLTGRDPGDTLLQLADYVTEMRMQKHPYEQGVQARKGVEF